MNRNPALLLCSSFSQSSSRLTSNLSLYFLSCSLPLSLVLLVCVAVVLLCTQGPTVILHNSQISGSSCTRPERLLHYRLLYLPNLSTSSPPSLPSFSDSAVLAEDRGSLFEGTVEPLWRGDRLLLAGHHWPGLHLQTWNVRSSMCRGEAREGVLGEELGGFCALSLSVCG